MVNGTSLLPPIGHRSIAEFISDTPSLYFSDLHGTALGSVPV